MSFTDAIRQCFRKYATFSGRAIRSEYWWFILFYVLASLVLSLIEGMLFAADPVTKDVPAYFSKPFFLAMVLPLLTVAWRRLHDSGRPGYYALLPVALGLLTKVATFTGVIAFTHVSNTVPDPESPLPAAAAFGGGGLVLALILQLAVMILIIYWMTRPSQPHDNAYGPVPAHIAPSVN